MFLLVSEVGLFDHALPVAPAAPIELSEGARDRLARSMPEGTRRAYVGDLRRFLTWAAGAGLLAVVPGPKDDLGQLGAAFADLVDRPDLPLVVAEYVSSLADANQAPATIERAIAAIGRTFKAAAGGARLNTDAARAVLRTHRSDRAASPGSAARKASPVTVDVLRRMVESTDQAGPSGVRDRALLVLGFAMGARRSELAGLDIADLTFTADGMEVLVRRSKTDKGSGDGRITGQAVALIVQRAARVAGLDPAAVWSGHSLRRGFATAAHRVGADQLRIARHGGWDDNSRALSGYVEEVDRWMKNPLIGIGL